MTITEENQRLYHYQGINDNIDTIDELDNQIREIGNFLKESLQANNLAFFIGSGCSTPAIPMMGATMHEILSKPQNKDILSKVEEYTQTEYKDNFSDIEGFLNWLQSGISFERNVRKKSKLRSLFNKMKKEFIGTIPNIDDNKYLESNTMDTYTQFYKFIFNYRNLESSKLSIFTTNYDLFNEIALGNNNFSYTTGFTTELKQSFDINRFKYRLVDDTERYKDRWQPVKKEVNLYKLHGSINWSQDDRGNLSQGNYIKGETVIYPTMLKHQETAQSPYSELFREFSTILQKPNTTLVIMGYGFPDEHINNIIAQNLQNQDFNLIVFGNINEEKMNMFYKTFNKKNNIHIIGGELDDGRKGHYFDVITNEYLMKKELGEKDE